jgi:hypothetical protein
VTESTTGFPDELRDWSDFDVAGFALGRALGIFGATDSLRKVKHVFWGDSPLGDALYGTLRALVEGGILEEDPDDAGVFRWSRAQPPRRSAPDGDTTT